MAGLKWWRWVRRDSADILEVEFTRLISGKSVEGSRELTVCGMTPRRMLAPLSEAGPWGEGQELSCRRPSSGLVEHLGVSRV